MTIIEKTNFLAYVYENYLGAFTNKERTLIQSHSQEISIFYERNSYTYAEVAINDDELNKHFFDWYTVYKNHDYIGAVLVYNDGQVAFQPMVF